MLSNRKIFSRIREIIYFWGGVFNRKCCGEGLIALYNAIKTRCSVQFTVEQKRDRVRELAILFQKSIVSIGGDESITYYVHAAVHHLPDQIVGYSGRRG